jgi:aminoglycoside phosphotransferase (APT) family kinase protein
MQRLRAGGGRPPETEMLQRCLAAPIAAVRELEAPRSTSYAVSRLVIDFADGRRLDVFHKNFDVSPHPQDVALSRGKRECFVYENVLAGQALGTPQLYGVLWDDAGGYHWLVLEFVPGRKLRRDPGEERIAAARWLGRLHRRIPLEAIDQPGPLLNYDRTYFADTAERAVSAVQARFADHYRQLDAALSDYETIVHQICSSEPTLVHGSYRAKNIIVDASGEAIRICPADWELAAVGPRLHDLAFIADGCDAGLVERLCESYADEAGLQVFEIDQMLAQLDRLRLHKALRSLARSFDWDYPPETVAKLVTRIQRIRNRLG